MSAAPFGNEDEYGAGVRDGAIAHALSDARGCEEFLRALRDRFLEWMSLPETTLEQELYLAERIGELNAWLRRFGHEEMESVSN